MGTLRKLRFGWLRTLRDRTSRDPTAGTVYHIFLCFARGCDNFSCLRPKNDGCNRFKPTGNRGMTPRRDAKGLDFPPFSLRGFLFFEEAQWLPPPNFTQKRKLRSAPICTADMTLLCATFAGAAPICVVLAMYHVVPICVTCSCVTLLRAVPTGGPEVHAPLSLSFPYIRHKRQDPRTARGGSKMPVRRPHAERKEGGTAHTVRNFDLSPIQ